MAWYKGPPVPKYVTGPNCEGCPYRALSQGFIDSVGPNDLVLIIGEAPGREELVQGRPFVGGSGKVVNYMMREHCAYSRGQMRITNTVRCRPIKYNPDGTPILNKYGDHVNDKPTPGMVRECTGRYMDEELANFHGEVIYGLGATVLAYFEGRPRSIKDFQGTIYEHGEMAECQACKGAGRVPGGNRNCPVCNGKGHSGWQDIEATPCPFHRKYRAKQKPKADCQPCWDLWKARHPECSNCSGTGKLPKPDKPCKACGSSGQVPANPDKPFVSAKLKAGQLFVPTLHPAYLMRDATQFIVVERDFARMHQLKDELHVEANLDYHYTPTEDQKTMLMYKHELSLDLETAGDVKDPTGEGSRITVMSVSPGVKEGYLLRPGDPMYYELLDHPRIIGQNWLQYDAWWVWKRHGKKFKTLWDTRLGGHLLNPDTPNNLVYLSREFATPPARGYWKTQEDYKERKDHVALVDADVTYRVRNGQYDRMVDRGILDLMVDHINPLCNVVFDMRCAGMRLDTDNIGHAVEVMGHDLLEERNKLPEWPATAHGWRSENQNQHVHTHLYTTLELPPQYKRGEAKLTADKDALTTLVERIELEHHSVSHLSELTKDEALTFIARLQGLNIKSKLESTFRKYRDRETKWVHPILNPAGTGTFRFSAYDPNVQQVPKCKCKGPDGKPQSCLGENPECRGARHIFLPDEDDWLIVRLDLKQAEVITFLWYAEAWDVLDQVLNHGHDIHELVADLMGLDRGPAKTCTFATLYGESPETTAARNHMDLADVHDMLLAYHKAMPGVEAFRAKYIGHAMHHGYIETPFRTRRYIRVERPVGRAANQAGNAPVQAVPPWILRKAMIELHRELPKPARLWNQVHDEIDIVTPPDLLDEVLELAKHYVTAPVPEMRAPTIGMTSGLRFAADVEIGPHWGALRSEEEFKCGTV